MDIYAYIAHGAEGFKIVDIKEPSNPLEIGFYPSYCYGVRILENYAYITGSYGLKVLDISNPYNHYEISFVNIPNGVSSVDIENQKVFVSNLDSLYIINISVPYNPYIEGKIGIFNIFVSQIDAFGDFVVTTNGYNISVIDVSYPLNPEIVAYYEVPSVSMEVFLNGEYIFVGDMSAALQIYALTLPEKKELNKGYYKSFLSYVSGEENVVIYISNNEKEKFSIFDITGKNQEQAMDFLQRVEIL